MLVKIIVNGVSQFVSEDNTSRLSELKEEFKGVIETDPETGVIKKYTAEDIRPTGSKTIAVEDLFGVKATPKDTTKTSK